MQKPIVTIHLIGNGYPVCRFTGVPKSRWPFGHISIPKEEYEENAAACRDPGHVLHTVLRFEICPTCETEHLNPSGLPDLPLLPSDNRRCERCGVAIVPTWPAVYCTNLCALLDGRSVTHGN